MEQENIENNATEVELDNATREYDYKCTTADDPNKMAFDKTDIGNYLLENIDWDKAEIRDSKKVEGQTYLTTGQYSFIMESNSDPSKKYHVSLSVTEILARPSKGKGKVADVETEAFKLSSKDVAVLDAAIAKFKQAGDIDNTVKLMTIKNVHARDGRVSRADFVLVDSLSR